MSNTLEQLCIELQLLGTGWWGSYARFFGHVISVFMFRFAKFPLVCCPAPPPDLKLMVGVLVLEYHLGILYIYLYICMVFAGWSCTALNIYVRPNGGGSLVCARPTQPYQI